MPFAAAGVSVLTGIAVLIGWSFDLEWLKRVSPGFVAMNPLTALAFILSGAGFAFFLLSPAGKERLATRGLALVVIWIGSVKLATLFGASEGLDIDAWLFSSRLTDPHSSLPNRMAPNTAVNFVLRRPESARPSPFPFPSLAHAIVRDSARLWGVAAIGGLRLRSPQLYRLRFLYPDGGAYGLHLPAPVRGNLFCHSRRRRTPGLCLARAARRDRAPASSLFVLLTLFLGWLRLWGERRGYYESEFGTLLFAITLCLIFVVLVRWTVGTVSRLEQERAESQLRLLEMNRRKDEMVAVVSHDLCSPLTGFQMVVNMLRDAEGKPDVQLLDLMDHSARRMAAMVRGLLEATKAQPPQEVQLEFSHLRLSDVVKDSMEPLLINANAKQIDFQLEVATDEPVIHADLLRVSQIFNNLLSNAVKYTPKGGRIQVRIEPAYGGVRAQVHDSGMGISEADLPHVFDKYFQGSSAVTAGEPGMGLGLALAREMAALHDGYIKAESEEGEGATFTVYLPIGLHAVAA